MTARMTGTEGSGLPVIPSTDVMMFRLFRSGFRNVPSFSVPDFATFRLFRSGFRNVPSFSVPDFRNVPSFSVPDFRNVPSFSVPDFRNVPSFSVPDFRNVPSFSVPDAMISSPFPEILSGSGHFRLSDPRKTGILYFDEQPFLKYFRSHSHERQKHP